MMAMQCFYQQLFAAPRKQNRYLRALFQLTRASLDQVLALKSKLVWETW